MAGAAARLRQRSKLARDSPESHFERQKRFQGLAGHRRAVWGGERNRPTLPFLGTPAVGESDESYESFRVRAKSAPSTSSTIPCRTASGSAGHRATIRAKSGGKCAVFCAVAPPTSHLSLVFWGLFD